METNFIGYEWLLQKHTITVAYFCDIELNFTLTGRLKNILVNGV